MMEKAEHMAKQQNTLEVFYKEYFKKTNMRLICWLFAGFLLVVSGIVIVLPYQGLNIESKLIAIVTQIMGMGCYLMPYEICPDNRNTIAAHYEKLQYLPVSGEMMRKYRLDKALRLQIKMYVVLQMGQLLCSVIAYNEVGMANVLYPLLVCGLTPLVYAIIDKAER